MLEPILECSKTVTENAEALFITFRGVPINVTSHCCASVRILSTSKNQSDFENLVKNCPNIFNKHQPQGENQISFCVGLNSLDRPYLLSLYTLLQNKRWRWCGAPPPPPPTNNFLRTKLTPANNISLEREFIEESGSF